MLALEIEQVGQHEADYAVFDVENIEGDQLHKARDRSIPFRIRIDDEHTEYKH